ncbi:trypsin-like peptidase domain-containing protein, partial [Klebsiella pneumoniae]|nr:trypsin-like peptidase domain-containing protein [Klebsiella pneumoniae]
GNNGNDLEAAREGSGVIYKKDGKTAYVVTNNHVVDKAQGLEVVLSDGTKVKGELVGTDAYTDLAVIKISSDKVDQV